MYLNPLDFAHYWQVESLVSISIVAIVTPPSFRVIYLHSKVELPR